MLSFALVFAGSVSTCWVTAGAAAGTKIAGQPCASCDLFFKFAGISEPGKSEMAGNTRWLMTANQVRELQLDRGVAQLAARVVRDDEVGSSSLLTPT